MDYLRLLAINGVSFAVAIIANVFLLLNMARRISFSVAQPVTIIGWYISSSLLLGLVIAAPHHLRTFDPNQIFSQAFYYAIIACVIYFTIATMMLMTVYGAFSNKYKREFKLTMSQRTLMLQTISFLVYLLGGASIYSRIEGWKFLDAVYWADVTLLTIGLGDFTPATHLGRSLLFPFAIGGILMIGLVIGSIRSLVLEHAKRKMGARMVEKARLKAIQRLDLQDGTIKLSWFKKRRDISAKGSSERDRREQEFRMMREIQAEAARTRRWTSLATSALVWIALWLLGAVVFWKSEHNQGWSYFEAVYFSYVVLLTIGYGEKNPMDEASKPFFVFWTLLAVPALTILISNMGETIIKGIRDIALWVGEWTVLPGKLGPKATLKRTAAAMTGGRWGGETFSEVQPVAVVSETVLGLGAKAKPENSGLLDRIAREFETSEEGAAIEAARRGDWSAEHKHHYHYLLMKEIKRVMAHLTESPAKNYTYHEWEWFLKLMGQDESSPKHHRLVGEANGTERRQKPGMGQIEGGEFYDGQEEKITKWSWIGKNSPLMGSKEEAEWVLEKLAATLERELRRERDNKRREKKAGKTHHAGLTMVTRSRLDGEKSRQCV